MKKESIPIFTLLLFSFIGLIDSIYLTIYHFYGETPMCPTEGCETVLTSSFSEIQGIPISILGVLFYSLIIFIVFFLKNRKVTIFLLIFSTLGLFISISLLFIQLFIIKSLCFYCLISLGTSIGIFLTSVYIFSKKD